MSVLIKGMEKPEHCGYCRFRYDGICHALQKTQYSMNECPLVVIDDAGQNDTISRQAAIANMNKVIMFRTNPEWKDRVAAYLKSLPSAQRWIPCSERLPEEKDAGILKKLGINKRSDDVIATVDVKGERMTVIACTHDGKWDWNMKNAFSNFKVVAWMPLPKPYEAERKEE